MWVMEECAGSGTFRSAMADAAAMMNPPFIVRGAPASEANTSLHPILAPHYAIVDDDARCKTMLDCSTVTEIDIFADEYPCQPFSGAGSKGGLADPRGKLFAEVGRVAVGLRSKLIIFEICTAFAEIVWKRRLLPLQKRNNYNVAFFVVNSRHRVPQHRERFLVWRFARISFHQTLFWNLWLPPPTACHRSRFTYSFNGHSFVVICNGVLFRTLQLANRHWLFFEF